MPARDRYHDAVKNALVKDGWTVTDDPFRIRAGRRDMYVDLGAQRLLAAEKGAQKIAVEIKTFGGESEIEDLQHALGQVLMYERVLRRSEPDRRVYLALTGQVFDLLFQEEVAQILLEDNLLRLIVFDPDAEEIREWTN